MLSVPSGSVASKAVVPCAKPVVPLMRGVKKAVPGNWVLLLKNTTEPEGAIPLLVVSTIAVRMTDDPEANFVPFVWTAVVVAAFVTLKLTAADVL
jgi:hypothetical protein